MTADVPSSKIVTSLVGVIMYAENEIIIRAAEFFVLQLYGGFHFGCAGCNLTSSPKTLL